MAQQFLAEKQSVVPLRASSASARAHRRNPFAAILSIALAALVSACVPKIAELGPEIRMPAIERATGPGIAGDRYVTRDGLRLGLMHWDAPHPFAILVALHGMNDYSNAFAMPAPWWAEHGISTYAYDQRSFGRSPNPGIWPGAKVLRRDLSDFVDVMRAKFPGVPVFVLGESMGGAVAMTAFEGKDAPNADGLILVAPAVWSQKTMPFSYRVALWTASHTVRWISLSGSGLKIMPSDNIPMLIANGRDPLFQKTARADAVYGLVSLMDEAYDSPAGLKNVPTLLMYGGNDQIIPKRTTGHVIDGMGSDLAVKFYPRGYHMLLRDLDGGARWSDIAFWIANQVRMRNMPQMASTTPLVSP